MSKLENAHARVPRIRVSLENLAATIGSEAQRSCLACHDTNGLDSAGLRECLICHGSEAIIPGAGMFGGQHAHTITNPGGPALGDADCVICHNRSDMNGVFELNVDLSSFAGAAYGSINDFCLACHDFDGATLDGIEVILPPPLRFPEPQGPQFGDLRQTFLGIGTTEERRATADIHGFRAGSNPEDKPPVSGEPNSYRPGYGVDMMLACTDCHLVHSSANHYLITNTGASASQLAADDPTRNAGVAVSERNFEQLCAVCHTNPAGPDLGNGLRGSLHGAGYPGDCVSCHYHGAGYIEPDRF
ncbi:MAG: hypothetical protein ACNA74_08755 [Desulfurivibrio sp.]